MSLGGRQVGNNHLASPKQILNLLKRSNTHEFSDLSINTGLLKHKSPIHFGGMSDPFSNASVSSTSREILKNISDFNYPTVLSTKNVYELCKDETINILKTMKYLVIQVSVSSLDDLASHIEKNAPSVKD